MDEVFIKIIVVLIGGLIGYITNFIAIKMLFVPYNEHKIFKLRIPFTPGIIPKNRYRISKSLSEMVVGETLSNFTPNININFDYRFKDVVSLYKDIDELKDKMSLELTNYIIKRFNDDNLSDLIANKVTSNLNLGFLMMLGDINGIVSSKLSEYINTSGKNDLKKFIYNELTKIEEKNINDLLNMINDKYEIDINKIINELIFSNFKTINFTKLVEDELNKLDIKEFEKILLKTLKKELRAITYLGAFLGLIIGLINILFI